MPKISFRLIGAFVAVFLVGGIAGFLVFWQGAKHGMLWATPDAGWVAEQDMANDKWDQAVKLTLARIRDKRKDYGLYDQVAIVYLTRAQEDSAHRDEWIKIGLSYEDRVISIAPNDWTMMGEAAAYERAGDISKNPCPYYQKALALTEKALSLLPKGSVQVGGRECPTQPVRTEMDGLIYRLQSKVKGCGSNNASAPNP